MIVDKPFNAERYRAERAEIRATIGENCEGWIYCIGVPLIIAGWVILFVYLLQGNKL